MAIEVPTFIFFVCSKAKVDNKKESCANSPKDMPSKPNSSAALASLGISFKLSLGKPQ